MKNLIFALMLLFASSMVHAEWQMVTFNDETTIYIAPQTINRSGAYTQVSQLMNFSKSSLSPDGKITYKSSITSEEYDCNKKLSRTLGFKWFSDVNGGGNMVYQDKHSYDFTRLVDGSLLDAVRKNICQI